MHVATASLDSLTDFLGVRGWIPPASHVIGRERIGNGPAVATIRVATDSGTTRILRQQDATARPGARATVAPADQVAVEGEFYRLVQGCAAVADRMPMCLGLDRSDGIVALEDLGEATLLDGAYRGRELEAADAAQLTTYLRALHGIEVEEDAFGALFNDGVRLARHADRFEEPIAAARVESLAARVPRIEHLVDVFRTDLHIRATMRDLGERFLEGRGVLLHGDFRPARWTTSSRGLRVLAPVFASAGPPALDLGFFVAHLLLAAQPHALVCGVIHDYRRDASLDLAEVSACVGLEIVRGRLGRDPVPGHPPEARLVAELEYAARLLRGRATVELPL